MAEPLKDRIDLDVVELLATAFVATDDGFPAPAFVDAVLPRLADLELKDRINLVADELATHLPPDYPTALARVVVVARSDDPVVEGFAAWPLCSFVERHGADHPDESLAAMPVLTRRMSCEFAVRPFLDRHLDLTREHLRRWVRSDDEAVRRLASEGTRPRLPWGPRVAALVDDPMIGLDLLEELRHDPSETVRRSVANHLNDVARADAGLVVEVVGRWAQDPDVDRAMVRHALRSLVKEGDPGALGVLGFTTEPAVRVESFTVSPTEIVLGDTITMDAIVVSTAPIDQRLVVDFAVHHVGADGSTRSKVFKWTTLDLPAETSAALTKRRRIATASTRRYHAGAHAVDLLVGGEVSATTQFDLLNSSEDER